jgi:alpha-glucosidase
MMVRSAAVLLIIFLGAGGAPPPPAADARLADSPLAAPAGAILAAARTPQPATPIRATLASPDGTLRFHLESSQGQLTWRAAIDGRPVIEAAALGIIVDGVDLGRQAALDKSEPYPIDGKYQWRGVKSVAVNRANGTRFAVRHSSGVRYTLDVRVSNDSIAFRHMVPGEGRRVPDAASAFRFPEGSIVWSHGLRDHYESQYLQRRVDDVPAGEWAAPPITVKLPGGGYAAVTEADLRNYAGMALQADGRRAFLERLAHAHPPGYPFTLRFGEEEAKRLAVPAAIDGPITTPWRVVIVGRDLDTLVNSDAVHNLSAPADERIFPDSVRTSWLKPGRAVWRYLDGGDNSVEGIKEFSRLAGELGFEYQVVEGQWQKWTEEQLRDVVEYSRSRGVGIWVWRHRNTLGTREARRALFARLQKAGVVGVKVDFLDHEAKEVIDLYQDILRDAAEHRLMINFHGANKPAGESRTWPNEMTREGIYGLEHRRAESWAGFNATFPFVRMLAGHADYTPVVFGERRRETSWAHQIASAVILTSPVLVYGGHPASLLSNPAVDMIRAIPSVWDETRVLAPSEIGELALFARRSGGTWFVAAMNGPSERTVTVDFSFLTPGSHRALVVRDVPGEAGAVHVETREITGSVDVPMRAGGGFLIRVPATDTAKPTSTDRRDVQRLESHPSRRSRNRPEAVKPASMLQRAQDDAK